MAGQPWDEIAAAYAEMLGEVPGHVDLKRALHTPGSEAEQRILLIEEARAAALDSSELTPATVQLLQFVVCAALRMVEGAKIHASAARLQGVSTDELLAASRVAWVVAGNAALNTGLAGISASEESS